MKMTVLTENTACRQDVRTVHGLSLYLETHGKKLLVDVGPGDEFITNAKVLGVDISKVELCVISHGHNDHGGGLGYFLGANDYAPVYLSELALEPCYAGDRFIGLEPALRENSRVRLTGRQEALSDHMVLFSQVPGDMLVPAANAGLRDKNGPDPFLHEQDLLIREGEKLYLFGGCAHRGIVNILEEARRIAGRYPDVVVSGLHLAAGGRGECMADDGYLDALAEKLLATGASFYSCHCTGLTALGKLKTRMGHRLEAISTGTVMEL